MKAHTNKSKTSHQADNVTDDEARRQQLAEDLGYVLAWYWRQRHMQPRPPALERIAKPGKCFRSGEA